GRPPAGEVAEGLPGARRDGAPSRGTQVLRGRALLDRRHRPLRLHPCRRGGRFRTRPLSAYSRLARPGPRPAQPSSDHPGRVRLRAGRRGTPAPPSAITASGVGRGRRGMTRGTQDLWATFAVGFVGLTWGCWWIFLRLIEARGISPGWTLATVYGASGLLLLPLVAWRWRRWRSLAWPVIAVGVAYGLPLAFWSHAVIHGNVVRVTLLFYMTPVWGTLVAVTAFGERLTPLRLLAVILGLIGAAAVLGLDQGFPIPRTTQEWMALLAGALFALAASASRRWPDVSGYDSSFVMFLCSAGLGVVFAGLFGAETIPAATAVVSALPEVAFLGIVFAI